MQNTQSGWTEEHKWCKGISYRGNNYDIPLHHLCFSVHTDCVFCIVPSIWYTFASLVFFCPPGLCVLHCSFYMIYLCITCVFLSTRIVCFALFPLYDIPLHHLCFSVHPDCVFCIVPSIWSQSGWTEEHKWCKGISYRGNNAKHTIRVDRKTQVMQRYII
jgi:hypothetical protein